MTFRPRLAPLGAAVALTILGVGGFAGAAAATPAAAPAPGPAAAAGAPLTITPNPVYSDLNFTVSGEGCLPDVSGEPAQVAVNWGLPDQTLFATPDEDGSWSVVIPASSTTGSGVVDATCLGYLAAGDYAPAEFTVIEQTLPEGTHMSVNPSTITAGGTTTISGTGCPRIGDTQQTVGVVISDSNGHFVTSGTVSPDESGVWSTDFTIDTVGTLVVWADCQTHQFDIEPAYFDYPTQSLTVNPAPSTTSSTPPPTSTSSATVTSTACAPAITLVDYTGAISPGSSMGVDLACFQPGEKIQIVLHSDPVLLTTLTADDSGNASGTVTIPLDTAVGSHTISAVGQFSGISLEAAIAIEAVAETSAATSTAGAVDVVETTPLADTGVNVAALTIWAVLLLGAGGAAVALTRHRGGAHAGD